MAIKIGGETSVPNLYVAAPYYTDIWYEHSKNHSDTCHVPMAQT